MKSEPWPSPASKSLLLLLLLLLCGQRALAQSNYVQHGDSGNYSTNGLPEEATLDGKVSAQSQRDPSSKSFALASPFCKSSAALGPHIQAI